MIVIWEAKQLLSKGYARGVVDKTLFTRKHASDVILVQVYVDDIILGSNNNSMCEKFVAAMQGEFEMSMMGELTYFLELQVKQLKHGTFLSQSKYCFDLLKKFKMEDCKEAATLITTNFLMDVDEVGQRRIDKAKCMKISFDWWKLLKIHLKIVFLVY